MFKIGEFIVHGRNGVCRIEDITHIDIPGADKDQLYYTLIPVKATESKVFYPVDSDKVVMRSVISKEDAEQIIDDLKNIELMEIGNERQRETRYKEIISSCDCRELVCMIKTLYQRNNERMMRGKRATYVDERYLREAKQNLNDEFAIALGIDRDKVEAYIFQQMN